MICALYARVSTVKQAERELSIPDQLKQMREWCRRNKGDLCDKQMLRFIKAR